MCVTEVIQCRNKWWGEGVGVAETETPFTLLQDSVSQWFWSCYFNVKSEKMLPSLYRYWADQLQNNSLV